MFSWDKEILINKGIITQLFDDNVPTPVAECLYNWTKSKTSLAEYFKWIGKNAHDVPGGFWEPIEAVFLINGKPIKRGSLRKLAGNNANLLKPDESKGLKEIKELLLPYRKQLKAFLAVEKVVLRIKNKRPKTIKTAIEKIQTILS